ncbi:hypothetical protein HII28_02245 [Planctomonas sp. JC2975]|uniref:hypothetical protein n=1 Tax=Planctomonas sp. JC2975 TaxID=2729626 RepID=UPI0014729052|nr:hypothetical protein [Planctomonas sp. JC2975]NNC10708.1 hypothetical protein [Planctomonas sp. JC2975]
MAISILAQRNAVATAYGVAAPYGCLFTSTGPGTSGSATNEVTGGSPAYARKAMSWSAPSNSAITGAPTFDVPSGTTVTYAGVAVSATAGTADIRDATSITSQVFSSQGTYQVTFTYTQA